MVRRLLLFSIVSVYLLGAVHAVFGDAASDLRAARSHAGNREFDQAEAIYRRIAADSPGTENAFAARRALPAMYVAWGKQSEAETAFETMLDEFSQHERLPHAIHEIAEECHKLGKAGKSRRLCEAALGNPARSGQAVWLHMGKAISSNYLNDDRTARVSIGAIIKEFASDERSAEAIGQIAWNNRKLEKHKDALNLYVYVVDTWAENKRAIFSQRGIVLSHIALHNREASWRASEELLERFGKDENAPTVVSAIAETYRKEGEFERARTLHQHILDNHPNSDQAMRSQSSLAICCIGLDDQAGAQAAVANLLSKYSGHSRIAGAVYQIARNQKDDSQAQTLYQYIVDQKPGDEHAILARANLGNIKIRQGDLTGAQAVLDKLFSDYAANPMLPKAAAVMADGYYTRALEKEKEGAKEEAELLFRKAIAEFERIITDLPETVFTTSEACLVAGVCYGRLGEREKEIAYYQRTVDQWPDSDQAWFALFKVGRTYEELKESGAIAASEADSGTKTAYERLVEEYPDCQAVKAANLWLRRHK